MIEVVFHGHSFVEVRTDDHCVLIDPFVDGNTKCDLHLDEVKEIDIDAIVITHGHSDHVGDSVAIAKATDCQLVATFEVANWLQSQGVEKVSAQHIGGEVDYEGFSVKFTPALHGGALPDNKVTGVAAGVLIRINEKTIYHAGDTALSNEMKLLGEYEHIAVGLFPIGDRFTMGIDDAVEAVKFVQPEYAVPIHYNTWPMIKADPVEFARKVMGATDTTPKALNPGQLLVIE